MTTTHFVCDNHHIISCYYTSSEAGSSFCHLPFVFFGDLKKLLRILCPFLYVKCHILERVII